MKWLPALIIFLAICTPRIAVSQSYAAGAGADSCRTTVQYFEEGGNEGVIIVGWILGFWSATTIYENNRYDQIIKKSHSQAEANGLSSLVNYVIDTCKKVPDLNLHTVMTELVNDINR